MPHEVKIPELGEDAESAKVITILVSVGDRIENGQSVAELETGKASVELPSSAAGTVKEVCVDSDQDVQVGDTVLILEDDESEEESDPNGESDETKEDPSVKNAPPQNTRPEPQQEKDDQDQAEPEEDDNRDQAEPEEDDDQDDDFEQKSGHPVLEIVGKSPSPPDDEMPSSESAEETHESESGSKRTDQSSGHPNLPPATPSARRLARELGVSIEDVQRVASGPRISKDEVKRFVKDNHGGAARGQTASDEPERRQLNHHQPLSNIQKATAKQVTISWNTIPQVTHFDTADITRLEQEREWIKQHLSDDQTSVTLTSFLIKFVAYALERFPRFNASLNTEDNELSLWESVNIGVAIDTDRGLLMPVIYDVNTMSIKDVASELQALTERARNHKLETRHMQGATFSISNIGSIGGGHFTPIVNPPQAAILGIGRAKEHVEPNGDVALQLPLSLSYDHRIINGADATRFLTWYVETLHHPLRVIAEDLNANDKEL